MKYSNLHIAILITATSLFIAIYILSQNLSKTIKEEQYAVTTSTHNQIFTILDSLIEQSNKYNEQLIADILTLVNSNSSKTSTNMNNLLDIIKSKKSKYKIPAAILLSKYYYHKLNNIDSADYYAQIYVSDIIKLNVLRPVDIVYLLNSIAFCNDKKKFSQAYLLNHYINSINIPDQDLKNLISLNIGLFSLQFNEYSRAHNYYNKSLTDAHNQCNDLYMQQALYGILNTAIFSNNRADYNKYSKIYDNVIRDSVKLFSPIFENKRVILLCCWKLPKCHN